MTERLPQSQSVWSVAIAQNAAIGHFNVGFKAFRELEDLMLEVRSSVTELDLSRVFELEIPAITNLALSIELFFKVHYFQLFAEYLKGHDTRKLSQQFPKERLENLRRIYREIYTEPGTSTGPEIRYSSGFKNQAKEWTKTDFSTYDLAINYVGSTYVKWRYIYEQFGDTFDMQIAFGPFYFLSQSLHRVIQEFNGPVKVSPATGPIHWHAP